MISKLNQWLLFFVFILGTASYVLYKRGNRFAHERDKYQLNTNALLSDVKRMQIDSSTMALDVKTLRLTLSEYDQYRAADLVQIEKMGVRIKDLEAAGKHNITIDAPVQAKIRDSVVIRDTVPIYIRTVKMNTPHLRLDGIIENNKLNGKIYLPVNLYQAVWLEYKHKFLWWRWGVKAVHQTISSDNPHAQINYSEFIHIQKK